MRKQMEKMIQANHRFANKLWATPEGLVFSDGFRLIEWSGETGADPFPADYERFFRDHIPLGEDIPVNSEFVRKVKEARKRSEQERLRLVKAAQAAMEAAKSVSAKKARDAAVFHATEALVDAEKHVSPFDVEGVWLDPRLLLGILEVAKKGTISLGVDVNSPVLVFDKDVRAVIMPIRQST